MQGSCHPACPAAGLVGKTKTRKMTLRTVPLHTSRVRFTSAVASSLYLPGQVKAPSSCPDPRLLSKRTSPRCSCAVWACLHHFRRTGRPLAQPKSLKLTLLHGHVSDSFVSYMHHYLLIIKFWQKCVNDDESLFTVTVSLISFLFDFQNKMNIHKKRHILICKYNLVSFQSGK